MRMEKVEVYNVNGHEVCAKDQEALEEYLLDIPSEMIEEKEYKGIYYVKAIGSEFKEERCKELNHLKINSLYSSEGVNNLAG